MKKLFLVALSVAVAVTMVFAFWGTKSGAAEKTNLKGTAYISGEGGHLAVIDLSTLKEPTDLGADRIVITEAGTEMEGVIAGAQFEKVKAGGGEHGAAFTANKNRLVVGLLNGDIVTYDLKTKTKSKAAKVGQKFCDAVAGPDGKIYLEDMADGHVYVWDPTGMKLVEKIPVGAAVCGIAWTKNLEKAYVSDMPTGTVYVLDWKTKKTIKKIKDPEMTFIHQIQMAPDGRHLWVSAPNEFDPGLKPGTHKSQIVVIDTKTDKVVEHIVLPNDVRPHDFSFSPDGKTVLLAARTYAGDSKLVVMNEKTHKIEKQVSACNSCHSKYGIKVSLAEGNPNLCGILVDWEK
ncbi:MAG: YncE family protein [Nitrospirota bacterium]